MAKSKKAKRFQYLLLGIIIVACTGIFSCPYISSPKAEGKEQEEIVKDHRIKIKETNPIAEDRPHIPENTTEISSPTVKSREVGRMRGGDDETDISILDTINAPLPQNLKQPPTYRASCKGETYALQQWVVPIAEALTAQEFVYDSDNLADCSGMFHRFLQALQQDCPSHQYPTTIRHRDTRSLAHWYHGNKKLHLVHNTLQSDQYIEVGAVMFYGYRGASLSQFTAKELFQPRKGINHVGIVVKVEKDANGKVSNYHLFHGRNPRHPAGITTYHRRAPHNDAPAFGNGREPWVAVAPVIWD